MSTVENIDLDELNKFNKLAHMWWDLNGPMGMLHTLNPLRTQYVMQHTPVKGRKILDVGCGAGILTESLSKAGAIVTGIDLTSKSLEVAKQHAASQQLQIEYFNENIEAFSEKNAGMFDVVTCLEVLEHVPDPKRVIQSCVKLLKPEGALFLSTINRTLKAYVFAILGGEYILRLLPKGTHAYKKFIKDSELIHMATHCGLSLKNMSSFMYNPFFKTFTLKSGADVNYIACFSVNKIDGLE